MKLIKHILSSPLKRGFWSAALVLLLSGLASGLVLPVHAQEQDLSVMRGERPSINGEPVEVKFSMYVIDIDEIDDVKQRFSIDMFVMARWYDSRLALPQEQRKGLTRFMSTDELWAPKIFFINDRGLETHLMDGVEVDDLGNVKFQNRFSGQMSANLHFSEFPFDTQFLPIDIVSYEYNTDELMFARDSEFITEPAFSIEGWSLTPLMPQHGVFKAPGASELPRLTFALSAKRDSAYYVLTMLLPMTLIVFMAWSVFWMQPNIVPPRISISTAAIFSLIALGVSIRLGLPKISYLTKADIFVIGCTLMVFMALGLAVLGSRWASAEKMEPALKANAIARWAYMIIFVIVAVLAYVH